MWGFGGRYYWGRKEGGGNREGIVVVFAWAWSQERHLRNYVDLYSSLGWNSLVCHPEFLNWFSPEKAAKLAFYILNELVEDDCRLVRDCISGHIYDSSPMDFTSDLGSHFAAHPTVLKTSHPPKLASWVANSIASGLDALFLSKFESQRAEYWQSLYSSASMGAPYLILYSETDDLAPYQIICNFAQRVQQLGGDVKLVKMNGSPHVGHYRRYPIDYKSAVTELGKAGAVYSQRIRGLEGERMGIEGTHDEISGPIGDLRKASASPDRSFRGVYLAPSDNFPSPFSMEYYDGRDAGFVQDERKESLIHLPSPPSINAHGVLGQILYDVCVPKNVEGWDLRSSASLHTRRHNQRHAPFNPIKCICHSRL